MDELEFRRRVYANPDDTSHDIGSAAKSDPNKQQFLSETRALNEQLKTAANIPVPDNLADKLIWQSALRDHAQQKQRARWHIAMAASVAFAVGLTFALWTPSKIDLGHAALAHMDHAEIEMQFAASPVSLELVNAKLESMGAELTQHIGNVYVANYCQLDNYKALHLIVDTEQGPVSLFVMPHEADATLPYRFSDDRYVGKGFSTQRASVMLVGDKDSDLHAISGKVRESLI
ncbi:DUF3379 domain-containing protein [Alteromonas sediminis]|uniref:DUF3379 domain-containing protein n=1 Tax=Alteromonas sediminis TaxID=2259342 RepID=A0A3N5YAB6_9ALTE|nr:DUF3379 family protein [Alteromonas sediminis]RPJ68449.1 DUF3379 domain-containing protein [Alteromonas sediminis]